MYRKKIIKGRKLIISNYNKMQPVQNALNYILLLVPKKARTIYETYKKQIKSSNRS